MREARPSRQPIRYDGAMPDRSPRGTAAILAGIALLPVIALAQAPADAPAAERPAQIDSASPNCQPAWPEAALKAGVTGTTVVRFHVDARGQVQRAEVVRAAGPSLEHRLLDYAFEQALASCPYTPGRDWNGRAVGGIVTATHVWQLPERSSTTR